MSIRCIAAGTLALLSTAVLAESQAGQYPIRPLTSGQTTTVLVGCLYRQIEVSGDPGDYDDYILADAAAPLTGPSRHQATQDAIGTSGIVPTTGSMYEVENVRDFRLEVYVGLRVELTGTIDLKNPGGSDQTALPNFETKTIRAVAGTCPPTPASRR
jgi:hypothetical protein